MLGKRGEVARIGDDIVLEQIPGVGTGPRNNGYVNRIATIGGELYVCGFRRQVCRRVKGVWKRFDKGLLEPRTSRGSSLEAIDGTASNCIYAVGSAGQIWHFDGRTWRQRTSPTDVDLHEVRCLPDGRVLIVGQRGRRHVGRHQRRGFR